MREMLAKKPPPNDLKPVPQLTTYYYMVNTTRKPLDDVRVRQALSLALDREEITRVATAAGEVPAFSLVPPAMPGYKSQSFPPRNPELARKLLAEAGYPGRPRLSEIGNPLQHGARTPGDRRAGPQTMAARARHQRHAAERRVGLRPRHATTNELHAFAPLVDRRLSRPQYVSRHVRHRTAKTTAPAFPTPSTTS